MYVGSGEPFEAVFDSGESGLVGTVTVKIIDNDGAVVVGPTTVDITEDGTSGLYIWNCPAAPAPLGQYSISWSKDGTYDPPTIGVEDLIIVDAPVSGSLPPIPAPVGGGLALGPCTAWITGDDVAACCSVETTDDTIFDDVAQTASQLLFDLSGRLYSGECGPKKVRPDCHGCSCGWQVTSGGHIIMSDMWGSLCDFCLVRCDPSLVKLSGYPIREITEVKVAGVALAPTEYRLHNNRYAMRLNNGHWPWRQNLTLADTETDTFSISYTYGQSPPQAGIDAAAQLACELYKACAGQACALPSGLTRQVRQGLTIERLSFTSWAYQHGTRSQLAGWRTGLTLVDLFLQATNPHGHQRRPVFYGPGKRQYAQEWQ